MYKVEYVWYDWMANNKGPDMKQHLSKDTIVWAGHQTPSVMSLSYLK